MSLPRLPAELQRVVIAVMALLFASAAGVAAVLAFSANAVDDVSLEQETALVSGTVERRLARLSEEVATAAVSTQARDALASRDIDWLQDRFAGYYWEFRHHTATVVYDENGVPILAARNGARTDLSGQADFLAAPRPQLVSDP